MSNVIKKGSMVKEGSKVKSWKKRWFVFRDNGLLEYYTDKKVCRQRDNQ